MSTVELSSMQWVEMAVFNTATLTSSFTALNGPTSYSIFTGSGFPDDIKVLKMYNDGSNGIILSYDGVTQNDFIPSKATLILDIQANHADNSPYGSGTKNGRKGQVIFGKGSAGAGNLYISGMR